MSFRSETVHSVGLDVHPSKVVLYAEEVGTLTSVLPWQRDARVRMTLDLLGSNALAALADGERIAVARRVTSSPY